MLLLQVLFLLSVAQSAFCFSSFSFDLPLGKEVCFHEVLYMKDRLDLSYEVSEGVKQDIDFAIRNPDGAEIHTVRGQSFNSFGFNANTGGVYEYCFSNVRSSRYDKVVTFIVRGPHERSQLKTKYKADEGELLLLFIYMSDDVGALIF